MNPLVLDGLVKPYPRGRELAGTAAWGRVRASIIEIEEIFGRAHEFDPANPYHTHQWFFETPRGRAIVRNRHGLTDQLQVASAKRKAAIWLRAYLRSCGLRTTSRY